ncbi:DUF6361 family protein [Anaeromyxobacter sp. Fw109-5]|uniref:DUF6361 family protein n=1 Tax=Anaeromyxobacter sp. (strain Fw109-5) TaxID=404589 RepID=UPI0000ED6E42|nr:DUF6361 family protein [Anaeromyxobacter sp. Fw109-5]ABS28168.1 hypothetical protein Anae109_3990 [Anaeromyxobacter sp. Fw109-5]
MTDSNPVAWLDFRRGDLSRARDFIRSLQGEGVLDELGYLALQGQFADLYYPATSTLMRAARYFYFVAGAYRQLERERVTSSQVALALRRRLDALREILSHNESIGIFGRDAKMQIKQLPSAVYWNGLRLLGMFTSPLSEAGYQARFDELRAQRAGFKDDDKSEQSAHVVGFWDPKLPSARFIGEDGKFRSNTNFALARSEAKDLAERFRNRFPESLFVHLLNEERPDVPFPWAAPRVTEKVRLHVEHAEGLSLLARGTTLQYYALVMEAQSAAKLPVGELDVETAFRNWWSEARPKLRAWDPHALASLPAITDALRPGSRGDVAFFRAWLDRLSACPSATAFFGDADARRLVRQRELDVKPTKARLKHRKHLAQWRTPTLGAGVHALDYRHSIGTNILREVLVGLGSAE